MGKRGLRDRDRNEITGDVLMDIPKDVFRKPEKGKTLSFHVKESLAKKIEERAMKSGAKSVSSYLSALIEFVLKESK
jgi:hypothetical protein